MEGLAPPFELAVLAGGCASAAVDITIYPLDTLKTRLQAPQGFRASGGYRGLFTGVTAAALGAVPGGAVFFGAYEFSRSELQKRREGSAHWTLDAVAGRTAATASCLIRTPAIVVQQRMQVGQFRWCRHRGRRTEGGISVSIQAWRLHCARDTVCVHPISNLRRPQALVAEPHGRQRAQPFTGSRVRVNRWRSRGGCDNTARPPQDAAADRADARRSRRRDTQDPSRGGSGGPAERRRAACWLDGGGRLHLLWHVRGCHADAACGAPRFAAAGGRAHRAERSIGSRTPR